MRLLTAMDEGELRTLPEEIWAIKRGISVKYIQQRLRNNYTEDEAVNLPKRATAKANRQGAGRFANKYDTTLDTKKDSLWLRFIKGDFKQAGMA